jgi:hypothetical protein
MFTPKRSQKMPKLNHAPASYPQTKTEFHVVTATGKPVYITNDPQLALEHPGIKAFGYRALVVTTLLEELTSPAKLSLVA